MAKTVTEQEVKTLIKKITKGQFFNMRYIKRDGSYRTATCQLGVHSPKDVPSPKGTGESAHDALEAGRVKYFEPNRRNPDGTVSTVYRQASISRIISITTNGETYIVKH
jgi:hypothetical protein